MPKRNLAVILLVVAIAVASWRYLPNRLPDVGGGNSGELNSLFGPLLEVYGKLDQRYVRRLDEAARRRFVEEAIRGAVAGLGDRYTEYYPPAEAAEFDAQIRGQFTGVGVEIEVRDGALTVVNPVESSPAFAAGIMPGDRIVRIDQRPTAGMSKEEAARLIQGPPDTAVTLAVRRAGAGQPLLFPLTRTRITMNPVKGFCPYLRTSAGPASDARPAGPARSEWAGPQRGEWDYLIAPPLAPGLGYIRVADFVAGDDTSTMARFDAAVAQVRSASARGLIIDLRDNTGGILDQAIQMVDRFVADGVIVTERGAHDEEVYRAGGPDTLGDWPLVVLINERSASASEIVAGSLAAHGRAVLVGQRTYGKGTKQETMELPGVGGGRAMLKLTVAYLYLPDGRPFDQVMPPRDFQRPAAGGGPGGRGTGVSPVIQNHGQDAHATSGTGVSPVTGNPGQDGRATSGAGVSPVTGNPGQDGRAASAGPAERLGGIKPTVTVELTAAEELALLHCRRKMAMLLASGGAAATQPEKGDILNFPDPGVTASTPAEGSGEIKDVPFSSRGRLASAPTTAPEDAEDLAREMLKVDHQLAEAVAILSNPARYKALLAKAPTTAAEEP